VEPLSCANFRKLLDAANPPSGHDKALVVGYWFQVIQKQDDLDGFQLNKELKNLGHPSTNITRDLDSLINRTPRFATKVRKEGNSKPARKKYKLTHEGIKAVDRMLRGNGVDAE
jgi:DNA-binding PadR family transcriptional regulator